MTFKHQVFRCAFRRTLISASKKKKKKIKTQKNTNPQHWTKFLTCQSGVVCNLRGKGISWYNIFFNLIKNENYEVICRIEEDDVSPSVLMEMETLCLKQLNVLGLLVFFLRTLFTFYTYLLNI